MIFDVNIFIIVATVPTRFANLRESAANAPFMKVGGTHRMQPKSDSKILN